MQLSPLNAIWESEVCQHYSIVYDFQFNAIWESDTHEKVPEVIPMCSAIILCFRHSSDKTFQK